MAEVDLKFELNGVNIYVPEHPEPPRYRTPSAPKPRGDRRPGATVLMELEGTTLEFAVPIGRAVDLALSLAEYRKDAQ